MKLPKLNAQGVAHHFLLAVIIVGIAAGGTYYLVKSKADACVTPTPTSAVSDPTAVNTPVSGAASSPTATCTGTSTPVTAPVSAPVTTPAPSATDAATVTISNVTNISTAGYVTPKVTILNTGTEAINPMFTYTYSNGQTNNATTPASLAIGQSTTITLPAFKPNALYTKSYKISVQDAPSSGIKKATFNVSKTFVAVAPIMNTQTLVSKVTVLPNNGQLHQYIDQFEASNLGKAYQLCATVKANRSASDNAIKLAMGIIGAPGTINAKRFAITTSYRTYCAQSTLPRTFYSSWPAYVYNSSFGPISVSNVTVKLR